MFKNIIPLSIYMILAFIRLVIITYISLAKSGQNTGKRTNPGKDVMVVSTVTSGRKFVMFAQQALTAWVALTLTQLFAPCQLTVQLAALQQLNAPQTLTLRLMVTPRSQTVLVRGAMLVLTVPPLTVMTAQSVTIAQRVLNTKPPAQ